MLTEIKRKSLGIKGGQLKFLSSDDLREIDYAAKDILWYTGVKILNEDGLRVLDEAGAVVDYKEKRAWIPPYLVDEAVKKAPKSFRMAGRNPKNTITLNKERVYFVMGVGPYAVSADGTMRKPTLKDLQDAYRVVDACENIDIAGFGMWGGPETPEEDMALPARVRMLRGYLRVLELTEKPIDMNKTYVYDWEYDRMDTKQKLTDILNLEIAVRGSLEELQKLPLTFWGCDEVVSPLTHHPRDVDCLLFAARHGLPLYIGSEPLINATGPATIAGTLALWTAEVLSGLVLGEMAADPKQRPPALWITLIGLFDQLTAYGPLLGSPEAALAQAACAQIAHWYGFPIRGIVETSSKLPDAQAGYETAVALLVSVMAGINYNTSVGVIGPGEIGINLEKIVLDNDLIGYIKRVMEGINVSDETLAVDVIEEVGPGGTFLGHPHTRKWFKKEMTFPKVFERASLSEWQRAGSKDARQRANERAREILKHHWPEPLDPDIKKRLIEYVKKIEKEEAHNY